MAGGEGHEIECGADVDVVGLARASGGRLITDGGEVDNAIGPSHEGLDRLRVPQVGGMEMHSREDRERSRPCRAGDVRGDHLEAAGPAQQLDHVRAQEAGRAGDDDRAVTHAGILSDGRGVPTGEHHRRRCPRAPP